MKAFTDLEQSKKLAEILPLESADMFLALNGTLPVMSKYIDDGFVTADDTAVPCWSLAALMAVMPGEVTDGHYLTLSKEGDDYCCFYGDFEGNISKHTFTVNPVDACVNMIIKLKEQKLL